MCEGQFQVPMKLHDCITHFPFCGLWIELHVLPHGAQGPSFGGRLIESGGKHEERKALPYLVKKKVDILIGASIAQN